MTENMGRQRSVLVGATKTCERFIVAGECSAWGNRGLERLETRDPQEGTNDPQGIFLNNIVDVLLRVQTHTVSKFDELLPMNW